MENVWVYDFDGTIQCDSSFGEIPLGVMAGKLALLVGKENILSQKKSERTMITLCNMPTGAINAYELTPDGWWKLENGCMGNQGFKRLETDKKKLNDEPVLGQLLDALTSSKPQFIHQLPGYMVRIYQTGDMLTKDYRQSRCNIETSEVRGGNIVSVWFG